MPIKNKKIINVIITAAIFVIVFCILTFGGIPVRKINVGDMDITESVSEADTKQEPTETSEDGQIKDDMQSDDSMSVDEPQETDDGVYNDPTVYPSHTDTENNNAYEPVSFSYYELLKAANERYSKCVGFDNSEEFNDTTMKAVKPSEINGYKGKYSSCSTYKMYSALKTDIERLVYRSYEYAFDHSYSLVFFDKELVGDSIDMENILIYFLLDSPVAEQNYSCSVAGTKEQYITVTYTYKDAGGTIHPSSYGYLVWIPTFRTLDHTHRAQAYEKACRIVADMPGGLSKMEKAKYLFRYLYSHTVYHQDGDGLYLDELYNALVLGRCVCDGYSNAFSLLCNLAGIPCFEKMYSPESGGDGHTWDCFCIDGVWYNADATENDYLDEEHPYEIFLAGFGFSDKFQKHRPLFANVLPECTNDTLYANVKFAAKTDTENVLKAVTQSWLDRNRTIGFVLTDLMNDDEFDNGLRKAMRSYDDMPSEVKTYYFQKWDYPDFGVLYFMVPTGKE